MKFAFFDIETNGLLDTVSHFHCGVIKFVPVGPESSREVYTSVEHFVSRLIQLHESGYILVGHNIIRYDYPALKILTPFEYKRLFGLTIDTLPFAWHILSERAEKNLPFSLEAFGEYFGVPKIEIEDWANLSEDQYIERCDRDVDITILLFNLIMKRAGPLYGMSEDLLNYTSYLNFKMDCIFLQECKRIGFSRSNAEASLDLVTNLESVKKQSLESVLPEVLTYSTTKLPNRILSSNKKLTAHAEKYIKAFLEKGTQYNNKNHTLKFVSGSKPSNAGSHSQMKSFLFSLGWEPDTYKTNDKGELVPQISNEDREVSESVKALYSKEPRLKELEGIYMLSHRAGVLKGFLENAKDNSIEASVRGLTSTLRFKHRTIVNLPGVLKPWGKEIRSCLVKKKHNNILIGCDMVAIEDMTKQHYMYYFDPDYVNEMRTPGFDPHLDLAVRAGFLTQEQSEAHKKKEADYTEERQRAKKANYSCTYGVGAPKLSSSTGMTLDAARDLIDAYWVRNDAIKKVANSVNKKVLHDNSIWVQNPISKFWMPLRSEKDIFSAVNQSKHLCSV